MKIKFTISVILATILLSSCGETATQESFSLSDYGECTVTESTLICASEGKIEVFSLEGKCLLSEDSDVSEPGFSVCKDRALIYGDSDIYVFDGKNVIHNYTSNKIMLTNINKNGYVAVCTGEAGYKGSVTVYDKSLTPVYKWYSASGYIIKAALSEKNTLAVLTANETGSYVHVFALDSETEEYSLFLEKSLAIDLNWFGEDICLLTETGAVFSQKGKIIKTVSFEKPLGEYAFGEDFLFAELQNGDFTSELVCLNENGKEIGSAECEMLRGVTVSGDNIAVITDGSALRYDKNLNEQDCLDARGVRDIFLCGDRMLLLRDCDVTLK